MTITLTANDIDFDLGPGEARGWYAEMLSFSQLKSSAKTHLEAVLWKRDQEASWRGDPDLSGSYHGMFHLGFLWYCHVKLRELLGGEKDNLVVHQRIANAIAGHDAIMKPKAPRGVSERESGAWWLKSYENKPGFLLTLEHADVTWVHETILATIDHFEFREQKTEDDILRQWFLGLDLISLAAPPHVFDKNTRMLRVEHSHLSDKQWADGRKGFLEKANKATVLYQHPVMHRLFEDRARANIARVMAA